MRKQNLISDREHQVLTLMAKGFTNDAIARELNIARRTVEQHITNIFDKLHVSDRTSAVVKALSSGWIDCQ